MQFLFAGTLLLSATLLFIVQPMFARMVLPLLGGSPAVWNTCMVFYQAALLAGYVYAHVSIRWLGCRRQAVVHAALLMLPCLVLPLGIAAGWRPPPEANPIPWLLALLAISAGLPFFVVSATAPMLQAWFAAGRHPSARDPYYLYAASNVGSIAALLGYPLAVEPCVALHDQARWWAGGYALLAALIVGCGLWLRRTAPPGAMPANDEAAAAPDAVVPPPAWSDRFRWLLLSLVPSSLLLGVTTFLSTDIAAMPLLWVVPLALYLLTFVLVFARRQWLPHRWMVHVQALAMVAVGAALYAANWQQVPLVVTFAAQLGLFFATAMVCHGELAAARPAPQRLTEFYLWMSLGGVLGGALTALAAPLVFSGTYEYPIALAAACLLRPGSKAPAGRSRLFALSARSRWWIGRVLDVVVPLVVWGECLLVIRCYPTSQWRFPRTILPPWEGMMRNPPCAVALLLTLAAAAVLLCHRRPLRFGLGVAGLMLVGVATATAPDRTLHVERSFFGIARVEHGVLAHTLIHGSTVHGMQSLNPGHQREPMTYYHRQGPAGDVFAALQGRGPLREVGVIGLGAGALSAYGRPGERFTFYEIDPAIVRIAADRRWFTYLADCEARCEMVLGDGRLSLQRGPPRQFDLLVLDAFSSDAIPVHLLTREALQVYLSRLAPRGVLAVHISNRYFNLEPVLGNLAADAGLTACVRSDLGRQSEGRWASIWVALARHADDLGGLCRRPAWRPATVRPDQRPWTDDFSNVLGTLRWTTLWRRLSTEDIR